MFSRSAILSLGLAVLPHVSAAVFDVQVGASGLEFTPEALFANVGDQVVFHFNPKNHTVTQSAFADPCGPKEGGFDSGFMPVAANTSAELLPTYTITVNDTSPVWVYCKQAAKTAASHCGAGMVFSVNCPADGPNSFTNFKAAALKIGDDLKAAANATSAAQPSATDNTLTAAYGGYTVPPEASATLVTQTITLDSTSIWTTTYSSYANAPAATPNSAEGSVIKVTVGADGLTFDPPRVSANPRDVIMFEFHAKNHTVTQSSFADPCRKLTDNTTTAFDSGFMPVNASLTEGFPTWNLTVNDTAPMWAYCKQKTPSSHCGAGMVFAINSDETSARNFSAFQNLAKTLNGSTSTSTASGAGASSTTTDGALSMRVGTAGLVVVFAALAALL
jgi:plastocyanin